MSAISSLRPVIPGSVSPVEASDTARHAGGPCAGARRGSSKAIAFLTLERLTRRCLAVFRASSPDSPLAHPLVEAEPSCRRGSASSAAALACPLVLRFRHRLVEETMAEGPGSGLKDRIAKQGEDALGKLAQDLLENPLVMSAISRAFEARERAVQAQETAMSALNIPSAADIERLTRRLRSVSQRMEGIEDAVDRVDQRLAGAGQG